MIFSSDLGISPFFTAYCYWLKTGYNIYTSLILQLEIEEVTAELTFKIVRTLPQTIDGLQKLNTSMGNHLAGTITAVETKPPGTTGFASETTLLYC